MTSFWRGAGYGLVFSAAGAAGFAALSALAGPAFAARVVIVLVGLAHFVLLLQDSDARAGRLVALAGWLAVSAALSLFNPTLWLWFLAQAGLAWLVRSLYRYESLTGAALDAGLCALALSAAAATLLHTRSPFLALWTYFLVQALHVLIPAQPLASSTATPDGAAFDRAYRSAESALRRLSQT